MVFKYKLYSKYTEHILRVYRYISNLKYSLHNETTILLLYKIITCQNYSKYYAYIYNIRTLYIYTSVEYIV